MTTEQLAYDVVILGAGGAGLRAAIAAAESGARVAVLSKSLLGKAHTVMAEGGIAAALGNLDPFDDWETHYYDTIKSGHYLNHPRMVEIYAQEAPARVLELEEWGAVFDRTPEGTIMQRPFGAHSFRRLAHVGDRTGKELIRTLEYRVMAHPVDVFAEVTATRILVDDEGEMAGVFAYRRDDGRFLAFAARALILATGGWGRMFRVTSNSWESTGDGAALAFRIGVDLQDMEMTQFHPTGMVWPPGVAGILVTEGVRGEGGLLYNAAGERFMLRYDPLRRELSSRDVVARSIYKEVQAGRGTPHGGAWLDISHKGTAFVRQKLPGMYEQFLKLADVDITRERFEVAPTLHYTMGGIRVEPETGKTNKDGIFACGETAAGLHGANRLGGNSLGDLLVFGRRAGRAAAAHAAAHPGRRWSEQTLREAERDAVSPFEHDGGENPYLVQEALQDLMTRHAGIMRSGPGLAEGMARLRELSVRAERLGATGPIQFNPGWNACFDVRSLLLLAEAVLTAALAREESRGAHWRADFPEEESGGDLYNLVERYQDGRIAIRQEPVPKPSPALESIMKHPVAPGVRRAAEARDRRERGPA